MKLTPLRYVFLTNPYFDNAFFSAIQTVTILSNPNYIWSKYLYTKCRWSLNKITSSSLQKQFKDFLFSLTVFLIFIRLFWTIYSFRWLIHFLGLKQISPRWINSIFVIGILKCRLRMAKTLQRDWNFVFECIRYAA